MGILKYESGNLRYRVVRTVNGTTHQRYFRGDQLPAAERYDAKLARLQERDKAFFTESRRLAAIPQKHTAERYSAPRRTAVMGLQIAIQIERRSGPMTRFYPCIVVAAKGQDGKRHHTCRFITPITRTLSEAWRQCCKLLSQIHGMKRISRRWLGAQPDVTQFEALVRYYRQQGTRIPLEILDHMKQTA